MAVYEVKSPNGDTQLVECRTSKGAIAHVATKGYTTSTLKMSDVVKRVKAGEQIQSIDEEKSPSETQVTEAVEAGSSEEPSRSFAGRFQKKSA